jgi:AcrR family transcriptional regulator
MPATTTTPRRTQQERSDATTGELIAAARELFARQGYAATSLDEIAAAANVTKGAVYHHFAGKEAVFRAVHAEVEGEAQARAIAARDPDAAPIDQIVAMVDGYLDAALDEEIRRITLIDGPALLGLEPDVPAEQHATQAAVRDFIAAAIARGEIVDVDPGVLMQLIGGLALQCGLLIARAPDPDATRATLGVAVDAMLRGLACIP